MQLSLFSDGHRSPVMAQLHNSDREYSHHHSKFHRVARKVQPEKEMETSQQVQSSAAEWSHF